MTKTITTFLLGAAMLAPLYLSPPAEAQSPRQINRLEEQVQEAKNRGDWDRAGYLERELNQERLRYQQRHGLGENNDRPGFIRFNLNNNRHYDNRYRNRGYVPANQGYYDQWGNWRRY